MTSAAIYMVMSTARLAEEKETLNIERSLFLPAIVIFAMPWSHLMPGPMQQRLSSYRKAYDACIQDHGAPSLAVCWIDLNQTDSFFPDHGGHMPNIASE